MAFYDGAATDLTALRSALVAACVENGWAWNATNNVLSKGSQFLQLSVITGPYLTLLAGTGAAAGGVTGPAPNAVRVGRLGSTAILFPISYRIFVFVDEVYLVFNYNVDSWQWLAFGRSTVLGLPGTGNWVGASIGASIRIDNMDVANLFPEGSGAGGGNQNSGSLALFWASTAVDEASLNAFVHHEFDGAGWKLEGNLAASGRLGTLPLVPLVSLLPNNWNSEAVLLPLRCYVPRPSSKCSLVVDAVNARITRIDNYEPGQVVTIGSSRWMVFPWYRKSLVARNGGIRITHTGTLGWAIRYEGP